MSLQLGGGCREREVSDWRLLERKINELGMTAGWWGGAGAVGHLLSFLHRIYVQKYTALLTVAALCVHPCVAEDGRPPPHRGAETQSPHDRCGRARELYCVALDSLLSLGHSIAPLVPCGLEISWPEKLASPPNWWRGWPPCSCSQSTSLCGHARYKRRRYEQHEASCRPLGDRGCPLRCKPGCCQ